MRSGLHSSPRVRLRAWLCLFGIVLVTAPARSTAEDWPQWRGKDRAGVWSETGIVDAFTGPALQPQWRTPVNNGYSGPAVAGGRVFVTDARRTTVNKVIERVLALDENSGRVLWTWEWEADYTGQQLLYAIGPRATPTVDGDRVYVLGSMGNLWALDTATGRVLWKKDYLMDFEAEIPAWGITGAPLVDGDRLICLVGGSPDAKVVAFNKFSGEEIWRALSSDWEPGYNQPTIVEAAGVRQLIIWHPRAISSLDPATGRIYWEVPHNVGQGMTIPTPVQSGSYLFFTSEFGGAHMLRLDQTRPAATVLWHGAGEQDPDFPSPDSIHSVISTPVLDGEHVYGVEAQHGRLRCLHAATGKQVWETDKLLPLTAPGIRGLMHGTAFFVRNGDRYFISTDQGELVIATLSPEGYREISRAKMIEPTHPHFRRRGQPNVHWSHPAYANRHVVVRNDKEIVRISLAKKGS